MAEVAPHLDTLPDAARRLRRLVEACGGEHFAVFLVTPGEPRRLVASLDSDYPGHSQRTAAQAETLGERFMRRADESSRPFWWTSDSDEPAAQSLAHCACAEHVPPPGLPGTSLALPLSAERDECGLIVITGRDIALTSSTLTDLHALCLSLFGLIARLKPDPAEAPPAMSPRQIECLRLTANGQTSEEIAARLGLSVHTTTQYLADCYQKLNAVNRVHAVAKAMRLGLID